MSSCYPTIFSIKAIPTFSLDQVGDHFKVDLTIYYQLIGKLINLACGIWPDIFFILGQFSCHNLDPWVSHLYVRKQVLKYLKNTINTSIV